MRQSAQNSPYGEFCPPPQIEPATGSYASQNYNGNQRPTVAMNANNNPQINYPAPTILSAETISGFPVCKSQLPDGSFELTFGGIIPAPPANASKGRKSSYVTSVVKAMNLPDATATKPSGALVRIASTEFLTYGNLQINTENYTSFPQKISCCTVCWKPPVYMSGRVILCLLGTLVFFYIAPIILSSAILAKKASVYNTYVARVRIAAENIKRNGGVYVADEPAALAAINRLRNIAKFGLPVGAVTKITPIREVPQYSQAPQFVPPPALAPAPAPYFPDNSGTTKIDTDPVMDKKEEDYTNLPQYSTIMPL